MLISLRNARVVVLVLAMAAMVPAQTPEPQASPEKIPASFADVAKVVEPAVVNIEAKGKVPEVAAKTGTVPDDSDDIMDFFRRQLPRRPQYAVGSGFIVDKAGYIVTNAHVIEDAARITVKLDSGEEYQARLIGSDELTDIAVIKVDAGKDLPVAKLGNSDEAQVGDWVLAIGSPFNLARTVTAGIVSQTKRETPQASAFQKFIQTDAAINKGNSGGPLVNMKGEVIGINSQIATSTGDSNGIGFALPANDVSRIYDQLVKDGRVHRGFLGVGLESVKPEFAKVYGLSEPGGAIVTDVKEKESASVAGLKVGDVITEFNGEKVTSAQDLIAKVAAVPPQQQVGITYYREVGTKVERKNLSLKLGERNIDGTSDAGTRDLNIDQTKDVQRPFGLTLSDITPAISETYKLDGKTGVIVKEINPASYIADVKISDGNDAFNEGDLIQRINRQSVTNLKTFNDIVSKLKPGDAVVMEVLAFSRVSHTSRLKIVQFTVQ